MAQTYLAANPSHNLDAQALPLDLLPRAAAFYDALLEEMKPPMRVPT
jgi:hypothetical protein